jgi:hypothetical protein
MTHVRTSPYYPQSNGKFERVNRTLKTTTIRRKTPATIEEARRLVGEFVEHYNNERLHSAIGYVTPADKMNGRENDIWAARERRLEAARERRATARQQARACEPSPLTSTALHQIVNQRLVPAEPVQLNQSSCSSLPPSDPGHWAPGGSLYLAVSFLYLH